MLRFGEVGGRTIIGPGTYAQTQSLIEQALQLAWHAYILDPGSGRGMSGWDGRGSASDSDAPRVAAPRGSATVPDGWVAGAPRDEIRPEFAHQAQGTADGRACLIIKADHRAGLDGFWKKVFPINGGKTYHFQAHYQAEGVAVPRRSIVAELHWTDARGRAVPLDQPTTGGYLRGATAMAETEFPT